MSKSRLDPMREAQVIQVIRTVHVRGAGTEESVCRRVTQYWSLEGQLLAENDPYADTT